MKRAHMVRVPWLAHLVERPGERRPLPRFAARVPDAVTFGDRSSTDVDLRVCVRCGGKLTVRAVLTDPAVIAKMLDALRRLRAPPAAA